MTNRSCRSRNPGRQHPPGRGSGEASSEAAASISEAAEALLRGFHFPPEARAPAFARAQVLLARNAPELLYQAMGIQKTLRRDTEREAGAPAASAAPDAPPRRFLGRALRHLDAAAPAWRRYDVDVLLCGTWAWNRQQEHRMWERLLRTLLRRGTSVLCLTPRAGKLHERLRSLQEEHARRVAFLDPRIGRGRLRDRPSHLRAREAARHELQEAQRVLSAQDVYLAEGAHASFLWNAARRLDWQRWAPRIAFEVALVRCPWLPLCNAVTRTARRRGRRLVTFQQGVVSHSIDVPTRADTYVCFGRSSQRVLERMDRAFAEAAGDDATERAEGGTQYVRAGSFFDPVVRVDGGFAQHTVLVFDQTVGWAMRYYGLQAQQDALQRLVRRLLAESDALDRLVVRLHPARPQSSAGAWQNLAEAFPERLVLSGRERPIVDDLRRASVALGLFSGALATAAACGLPTCFLTTPGGFYTPDLDCFAERFGEENELFETIQALLRDREAYRRAQEACLERARDYYESGTACSFDEALVERILSGKRRTA